MTNVLSNDTLFRESETCIENINDLVGLLDDAIGSEILQMAGDIDINDPRVDSAAVSASLKKINDVVETMGREITAAVNDVDVALAKRL